MWASLVHHGNCFDGGQMYFFLEGGGGSFLNKSSVVEKTAPRFTCIRITLCVMSIFLPIISKHKN